MRRDNREQEAEELNSKVPVRDEQNRKQGSLEAKLGPSDFLPFSFALLKLSIYRFC